MLIFMLNDTYEMENKCIKMFHKLFSKFYKFFRSSINVFEVLSLRNVSASSNEMHFGIFPLITEVGAGRWRRSLAEVSGGGRRVEIVGSWWRINFRILPLYLETETIHSIFPLLLKHDNFLLEFTQMYCSIQMYCSK